MKRLGKALERLLLVISALVLLILLTLLIGIRIDLTPWRDSIQTAVNDALPYELVLAGDIEVTASFLPAIHLTDISLLPADKQYSAIATIERISGQIALLPLLKRSVVIDQFLISGVALQLQRDGQGVANWEVTGSGNEKHETEGSEAPGGQPQSYDFDIRQEIVVRNITVKYQDDAGDLSIDAEMAQMTVRLEGEDDLRLVASGHFQQQPWSLAGNTSLKALLAGRDSYLKLSASLADMTLSLNGHHHIGNNPGAELALTASLPTTAAVEQLFGTDLAVLAPGSISAQLTVGPEGFWLEELLVELAGSRLEGELTILKGDPPDVSGQVAGQLTMSRLDLTPWLELQTSDGVQQVSSTTAESNASGQENTPERARQPLSIYQLVNHWLNRAKVDVTASVDEISGLPVSIENLSVGISVDEGTLAAPMSVTLGQAAFRGRLVTKAQDTGIAARVRLSAKEAEIGELVEGITGTPASGHVVRARVSVNTRGSHLKGLLANASLNLQMDDGELAFEGGLPWQVNTLAAELGLAKETSVLFDGVLLAVPVNLELSAAPLLGLRKNQPWKMQMNVNSPAFKARADGFVSSEEAGHRQTLNIELQADHLGDLSTWLGVRENVKAALVLKGQLNREGRQLALNLSEFRLGESHGIFSFLWQPSETDSESGFVVLDGHMKRLNMDEIMAFWPDSSQEQMNEDDSGKKKTGVQLNVPVLPHAINIVDADLSLAIDRLLVVGQEVGTLHMAGNVRDGWLQKAPFSAVYAQSQFDGDMALDLRHQETEARFNLSVVRPDLGRIFSELGLAEGLDLQLDSASLMLALKGQTAIEMMRGASLDARLQGGLWKLQDSNSGAVTAIRLEQGSLQTVPEKEVSLAMAGELKQLPISMTMQTLPLNQLLNKNSQIPLTLAVNINDMALKAHSWVDLPVRQRSAGLQMELSSPSLSRLNELLDIDLPPYGPLLLTGQFETTAEGYRLSDLKLAVGSSMLLGQMSLDTRTKPDLNIRLQAPSIQIDDFKVGDWQAWRQPAKSNTEETPAAGPAEKNSALLNPDVLTALNADFKLDVDKVLSGKDRLGQGRLYLQLQDGNLILDPFHVVVPGGDVNVSGFLKPVSQGYQMGLRADVDHFDYGVLARRVKPGTKMAGKVSVRMDINTEARVPNDLFSSAGGQLAFSVWPREFESGLLDLWAVSLATVVLPELGAGPSLVNCAVGTFILEKGAMTDNILMLDTSAMQVLGNTRVDFTERQIELQLIPRAKSAQIFALELPIQVSGSFRDFRIGVTTGEIFFTTLRFVTSPVTAPVRWLLERTPPADGSQLCEKIFLQGATSSNLP